MSLECIAQTTKIVSILNTVNSFYKNIVNILRLKLSNDIYCNFEAKNHCKALITVIFLVLAITFRNQSFLYTMGFNVIY